MTDIVERLRFKKELKTPEDVHVLFADAAAEIERLREALQRLAALDEFVGGKPQTIEEVMNYTQFVARAALGEEK